MTLTLVPAYGRDYRNKMDLQADFLAGKDFRVAGFHGDSMTNKEDLDKMYHGEYTANVRYARMTKVAVLKFPVKKSAGA